MGLLKQLIKDLKKPSRFPVSVTENSGDLVYMGGQLSEDLVLSAYAAGCFPWSGEDPIPWYSPDPRLVLFPRDFKASLSLKKIARSGCFRIRYDSRFREVMTWCKKIPRQGQKGSWITDGMISVYGSLHDRGLAHSVEVWREDNLVGGLYGLALGRAFFGESMFSRESNTSKLALYALCQQLLTRGFDFIDCQQVTPHLMRLGARPLERVEYLQRLQQALDEPYPQNSWQDWPDFPNPDQI